MTKLTEQIIDQIAGKRGVSADRFTLTDITNLSDRDQKLYQRTGLNNNLNINSGSTTSNFLYQLTQKADKVELQSLTSTVSVLQSSITGVSGKTNSIIPTIYAKFDNYNGVYANLVTFKLNKLSIPFSIDDFELGSYFSDYFIIRITSTDIDWNDYNVNALFMYNYSGQTTTNSNVISGIATVDNIDSTILNVRFIRSGIKTSLNNSISGIEKHFLKFEFFEKTEFI